MPMNINGCGFNSNIVIDIYKCINKIIIIIFILTIIIII